MLSSSSVRGSGGEGSAAAGVAQSGVLPLLPLDSLYDPASRPPELLHVLPRTASAAATASRPAGSASSAGTVAVIPGMVLLAAAAPVILPNVNGMGVPNPMLAAERLRLSAAEALDPQIFGFVSSSLSVSCMDESAVDIVIHALASSRQLQVPA